jgi:hypothetical protein
MVFSRLLEAGDQMLFALAYDHTPAVGQKGIQQISRRGLERVVLIVAISGVTSEPLSGVMRTK